MPVELRVGGTGAGLFVGCGAGIGIVTPLSLHAVPVVGQLAASLATSLSTLNSATGGVTSAARRRVRSLGVPGLDLGFGCGVMLGYGWGAGLMLKPSALQSLTTTLQSAGRAVAERLPQPVQAALAQRHAQQAAGSWGLSTAGAPSAGLGGGAVSGGMALGPQDLTVHQQPGSAAANLEQPSTALHSLTTSSTSSSGSSSSPPSMQQQQQGDQQELAAARQELAELSRLVLKQQNQLSDMQEQMESLQAAVCKLDASAPGCKRRK